MKNLNPYFIGLDIGTDSVGYAVTDENYRLCRFKGSDMWGSHIFEEAERSAERRAFRTGRRRIDRRQQRVQLIQEIFAKEIAAVDPLFYQRIRESALLREDAEEPTAIFNDKNFRDKDYHRKYPTIHHLIFDLMKTDEKVDVRLAYLACAWLVAHRGHFLLEVDKNKADDVRDFHVVYQGLISFFRDNCDDTDWSGADEKQLADVLKGKSGVSKKTKDVTGILHHGRKADASFKTAGEEFPYSSEAIVKLICGGTVKLKALFGKDEYDDLAASSVSLDMKDEDFEKILADIGDDGELLLRLKAIYDWSVLCEILNGHATISEAKIEVYDQHKKDLADLKKLMHRYMPKKYNEMFRDIHEDNYVAYSGNEKSARKKNNVHAAKSTNQENFLKYVNALLKQMKPSETDKALYDRVSAAVADGKFMPKQVNTDNRVIPYQLYWVELNAILKNLSQRFAFLSEKDGDGMTATEKILSVFEYRIPYFVGPLNSASSHAWIVRKAGKILPWNFNEMVDLDASEQKFIDRMTGQCTYLPSETVLPKASLMYCRFVVLNEINNIRVNGIRLEAPAKQELYHDLFENRKKVTRKAILDWLVSRGLCAKGETDSVSGIDIDIHGSLSSYIDFREYLTAGILKPEDVERIIERITCTEDRGRLRRWLKNSFPMLKDSDLKKIGSFKYKDFGNLSAKFLNELQGCDKETGEIFTVLGAMWTTSNNLMELLSDRFTFMEAVEEEREEYYEAHKKTLNDRLDDMYVSNAVKRPIIRTLDILHDVVKAQDRAPAKIFVEMARGASEDQKKKRTVTRKNQLLDLYGKIGAEAKELQAEIESMTDADNRLQSDKLFLYYLQLGKCLYTGKPIDLAHLADGTYNIEHIYPRAKVKDDSILNNKALVLSEANGQKSDTYPIEASIQKKMAPFWNLLRQNGLITEEKYRRLTRTTAFTVDEEWEFIARQMVETRQSTKVVATLLKEQYPEAEIVYVKAGLVSEFRQEFDMLKSRQANDLHHAKDAYLNIVVGNVYHQKFTKNWFLEHTEKYSIKTDTIFGKPVYIGKACIWQGGSSIDAVRKTVGKNTPHYTRYAFCRNGGYFDQNPLAAGKGAAPRKAFMPIAKYGGYDNVKASFFVAAKYTCQSKTDVIIMPVELLAADHFRTDKDFALRYASETIAKIIGKEATDVSFPMNGRIIKINTVFEFDGYRMCLSGKANGGAKIILSSQSALNVDSASERYIKRLESFTNKKKENPDLAARADFDHITKEDNAALYELLYRKLSSWPFCKRPGNPSEIIADGTSLFEKASIEEQIKLLMTILSIFGRITGGEKI